MPADHRTREATESVLADLRETHGEFDVVEKVREHPPAEMDRIRDRPGRGGAGVWLTDDDGRVLLVRNEGDRGWGDPGGKREPGERLVETARRELREETGVDCRIDGLHEVHRIEHRVADGATSAEDGDGDGGTDDGSDDPEGSGAGRASAFEVIAVFDGEYVGGEPRPREGEIAAVDWFEEPPETVLYEEVATLPYPASE